MSSPSLPTPQLLLLTLLSLLDSPAHSHSLPLKITFTYQSYLNDPIQWFSMFTLCLAPLVTHVAFGLPKTVILSPDNHAEAASTSVSPPWTECLTHFNPVTLVWRYYSIAYARLRSPSWDAADLAAVNAAFWDPKSRRWDGSEITLLLSRRYLSTPPQSSHVKIASGSTLATIALTLQGVQAIFFMVGNAVTKTIGFAEGLPGTFVPLGLLGLLRLPAASWVSNDWGYTFSRKKYEQREGLGFQELEYTGSVMSMGLNEPEGECWTAFPVEPERRRLLDPRRSWKCILYRLWWISSIAAVMSLAIMDIAEDFNPRRRNIPLSISHILYLFMYLELCVGMLLITTVFVLRRDHTSTIIPCIQSRWYKGYTWLMMVTAVAAVVVLSLETVQLPDGRITTTPPIYCYGNMCEPWNRTSIIAYVSWEWDRYLNATGY
jgi:hypothetical protein